MKTIARNLAHLADCSNECCDESSRPKSKSDGSDSFKFSILLGFWLMIKIQYTNNKKALKEINFLQSFLQWKTVTLISPRKQNPFLAWLSAKDADAVFLYIV